MTKSFCFFIYILFSMFSHAQQANVAGVVSIHNSGYHSNEIQYVDNVLITAPFSKPSISDANGQFKLTLVGIPIGTDIKLIAEKQGYEIVNSNELENVVLGRKSNVHVYLIEKGGLIAAQLELLKISKTALYHRRDSIIQVLRSDKVASDKMIKDLEERFQQELVDREAAENMLNKQVAELEKQLPAFTLTLAKQNLDFASELYKTAYTYFLKGEIEKVKKLLNNQTLAEITKDGENHLENAKNLKEQSEKEKQLGIEILEENIRNYEFRAEMFLLSFDYEKAIEAYDSILAIMEHNDFDDVQIALAHDVSAQLQFQVVNQLINRNLDYEADALQVMVDRMLLYQRMAVTTGERSLDESDIRLATIYSNLARALLGFSDDEYGAFFYVDKVITVLEKNLDKDQTTNNAEIIGATIEVATFLSDLADYTSDEKESQELIDLSAGMYDLAIYFCQNLASPEKLLGRIYARKANEDWITHEEKIDNLIISNRFYQNSCDTLDPILAKSYFNLAKVCATDEAEIAMNLLKKALFIYEHVQDLSSYDFHFQQRIETFEEIAFTYQIMENVDSAEVYHLKYIEAVEKEAHSNYDWFSRYDKIIQFYSNIGDHQKVIEYNKKYLLEEKNRELFTNWHDLILNDLASAYGELKNYDSAHYYFSELIDLTEDIGDQDQTLLYFYKKQRAMTSIQLGDYSEASSEANSALKYYEALEDAKYYVEERLECLSIIADAHEKLGNVDSAILQLEEMKKLRRKTRRYNPDWRMDRKNDKKRIKSLQ